MAFEIPLVQHVHTVAMASNNYPVIVDLQDLDLQDRDP